MDCQSLDVAKVYSNLDGNRSHVVNTGWAMLALIDAGQSSSLEIDTRVILCSKVRFPCDLEVTGLNLGNSFSAREANVAYIYHQTTSS
ncbi:lupeol synthase [Cajanus cajan]|uniref:lupeol synthase n=1 Tax=Cajanus cajan TaxID=3821 RepID=UPI00098DC0D8|nr:lupeol synthase [Cajanus cajan]